MDLARLTPSPSPFADVEQNTRDTCAAVVNYVCGSTSANDAPLDERVIKSICARSAIRAPLIWPRLPPGVPHAWSTAGADDRAPSSAFALNASACSVHVDWDDDPPVSGSQTKTVSAPHGVIGPARFSSTAIVAPFAWGMISSPAPPPSPPPPMTAAASTPASAPATITTVAPTTSTGVQPQPQSHSPSDSITSATDAYYAATGYRGGRPPCDAAPLFCPPRVDGVVMNTAEWEKEDLEYMHRMPIVKLAALKEWVDTRLRRQLDPTGVRRRKARLVDQAIRARDAELKGLSNLVPPTASTHPRDITFDRLFDAVDRRMSTLFDVRFSPEDRRRIMIAVAIDLHLGRDTRWDLFEQHEVMPLAHENACLAVGMLLNIVLVQEQQAIHSG